MCKRRMVVTSIGYAKAAGLGEREKKGYDLG